MADMIAGTIHRANTRKKEAESLRKLISHREMANHL